MDDTVLYYVFTSLGLAIAGCLMGSLLILAGLYIKERLKK